MSNNEAPEGWQAVLHELSIKKGNICIFILIIPVIVAGIEDPDFLAYAEYDVSTFIFNWICTGLAITGCLWYFHGGDDAPSDSPTHPIQTNAEGIRVDCQASPSQTSMPQCPNMSAPNPIIPPTPDLPSPYRRRQAAPEDVASREGQQVEGHQATVSTGSNMALQVDVDGPQTPARNPPSGILGPSPWPYKNFNGDGFTSRLLKKQD